MADEIENQGDDVLELGDDTQPADTGADTVAAAASSEEDEFEIPTFGDDGEDQEGDTNLVKHLRDQIRERDRRLSEIEKGGKPEPAIVVGEKPTLEGCEWDEEKFETELTAWHERKRQAEQQVNAGKEQQQREQEAWKAELAEYGKRRAALPFKDVEEAENTVVAALNQTQQALIVKTANNPATLIYALGKNPAKLATLAGVTDPVKFIAAAVRLEGEMKMAKRRPAVEPEKIVRGSGSVQNPDKARDKLIEKAQAGGDVTDTLRALREQRKANRAA